MNSRLGGKTKAKIHLALEEQLQGLTFKEQSVVVCILLDKLEKTVGEIKKTKEPILLLRSE